MNPYEVLGVYPEATEDELNRAYRQMAKRYHPDLHPGDETASRRMGEINQAYDAIKAQRRQGGAQEAWSGGAAPWEEDPFAAYRTVRYRYAYVRRRSLMGRVLAVVVMFFLVRLLLAILFGGTAGYYSNPRGSYGDYPAGGYYYYYDSAPQAPGEEFGLFRDLPKR